MIMCVHHDHVCTPCTVHITCSAVCLLSVADSQCTSHALQCVHFLYTTHGAYYRLYHVFTFTDALFHWGLSPWVHLWSNHLTVTAKCHCQGQGIHLCPENQCRLLVVDISEWVLNCDGQSHWHEPLSSFQKQGKCLETKWKPPRGS